MKKKITLSEETFNQIFPNVGFANYISMPRKMKKREKKRLEKELSCKIKDWLHDFK
ncbi:hypothetical protein UFOVP699_23 [uncultured Caudovirales phage]|uniref:Uncharacterized protein n=1 Tax=uncultured Caudovirales phage TaxID=2100421 RepID=A0A6J5NIW8_9CAUD|nr:hypothetical protein UFOVP699_23 [uncultured Caudovirales phage]